jgi:predicted phosphodiesterase
MRIAALYDVHGNLDALEAVLAEIERRDVDLILVGGDVAMGPFPSETLERLRRLPRRVEFLRGNADREVAKDPDDDSDAAEPWAEKRRWVSSRLDPRQRAFLRELPTTLGFDVDGLGPTLFCHGSPRSDEEILTRLSSEARLGEILAGVRENVIVCGHTHAQFDRRWSDKRIVNAGSVGLPYVGAPIPAWATFGPDVRLERTPYDFVGAGERIRASGFPGADEFVEKYVLRAPMSDEVSELFERMAIERARASH